MGEYLTRTRKQDFHSIDNACWQTAIKRHNDKCKKKDGTYDKNYIELENEKLGTVGDGNITSANDLLKTATKAHGKVVDERGSTVKLFSNITSCLNRHAKALDVFSQMEPMAFTLVWGSVRFLLEIGMDSVQASEITADGILLIARHLERWQKMVDNFGHEATVTVALTDLYTHVLGFLIPAIVRFRKTALARLVASVYPLVKVEFAARLSRLRDAGNTLDQIIRDEYSISSLAHAQHCARAADEILRLYHASDVSKDSLKDAMDIYLKTKEDESLQFGHGGTRRWLDELASPVTAQQRSLPVKSEGMTSGSWLENEALYQAWQSPEATGLDSNRFLWVTGSAGTGKSGTADKIADNLLRESDSVVIAHAFRSNVSAQHRSLTSFAATILHYLLSIPSAREARDGIFRELNPLYTRYKSSPESCPFDKLWPHCISMLSAMGEFTLIIDGLDECNFNHLVVDARELLHQLSKLLASTMGRVIIFSRFGPSALTAKATLEPTPYEIRITVDKTRAELEAFCDSASAKLPFPAQQQKQVAAKAKFHANGNFQWVIQFLLQIANILDHKSFLAALDGSPDSIRGFYSQNWRLGCYERLGSKQRGFCKDILLILLGTRKPLSFGDIEAATGLFHDASRLVVLQHCRPLVQVVDNCVELGHASVRDFLLSNDKSTAETGMGFTVADADALLAQKCLEFLLLAEYGQKDRIGQRLRESLGQGSGARHPESSFYEYAARYWSIHLTALSSPSSDLLSLAGTFLQSFQFAYWAEYSYIEAWDLQAIRSTEIRLTVWERGLPKEQKPLLHLVDYFELPYTQLNGAYKEANSDKTLQWLALMRLGMYYFDKGKLTDTDRVRSAAAAGLAELLGPRHPLTLQARSDAANALLWYGRLGEAHNAYKQVAEDQSVVLERSDSSQYFTLAFQAQAEYLMTQYAASRDTLASASAGLLRTTGPESNGFLAAQAWYAVVDAWLGNVNQSLTMLVYVRDKRKEQYGQEDSFAIVVQLFAAALYQRIGDVEQALTNIRPALAFRRQFWSISHHMTIDAVLLLAIACRDAGMDAEAADLVEELEKDGDLGSEEHFSRLCQVKHIRGLLLFDGGNVDRPIKLLQTLLIDTDRKRNNRALLWVRLDLAAMMRYRGGKEDEELANAQFDNILADDSKITNNDRDEPDPPRLLKLAEAALMLVRKGQNSAAEDLLRDNSVRWVRKMDFWMQMGSPAADTGWMKPPSGVDNDASSWTDDS